MDDLATLFIVLSMPLYIVAFVLYLIRGVKGPTVFDTTIAIDAMCYDVAAFMVILAVYFNSYLLLSISILMALWAYILDVVVARYYERSPGASIELKTGGGEGK